MRRFSSALTRSAETGSPAGIPSRTATRPRPCDSPAVVKRNITLRYLPPEPPQPPPTSTNLPTIAREPDSGPGSRGLQGDGVQVSPSRRPRVRARRRRDAHHSQPVRPDPERQLQEPDAVHADRRGDESE